MNTLTDKLAEALRAVLDQRPRDCDSLDFAGAVMQGLREIEAYDAARIDAAAAKLAGTTIAEAAGITDPERAVRLLRDLAHVLDGAGEDDEVDGGDALDALTDLRDRARGPRGCGMTATTLQELAATYTDQRKKAGDAHSTDGAAANGHAACAHVALLEIARREGITTDEAAARVRAGRYA